MLPRLTSRIFTDLSIWMAGFGLTIGLIFPPLCLALGLPADRVFTPWFYFATLAAGLLVGGMNFWLARLIVGRRLRTMADSMEMVERQLATELLNHDWRCVETLECVLPVDSDDEVGSAAAAFNRLVGTLARSHHVEEAMLGFSSILSTSTDLATLAERALDALRVVAKAESGALLVVRQGELEVAAVRGDIHVARLIVDGRVLAAVREPTISHLRGDPTTTLAPASDGDPIHERLLMVPVCFNNEPLALVVLMEAECLDPDQLRLLDQFARDLGLALNNALAHERLEALAALDSLTQVYNRRFGLARLDEELARSLRTGKPLGLLMFDIDRFKVVNDTYGHVSGDRVLRDIAAAVRAVLRDGSDVLIRYGGEEFLVLLTDVDEGDVLEVAERLRATVEALRVDVGHAVIGVTVSVGAAVCRCTAEEDPETLLALVDGALYKAKSGGRDRVAVANVEMQFAAGEGYR